MTTQTTNQPRQTCCRCLKTTSDYTTERIDRRTRWQVLAGRAPATSVAHTCRSCTDGAPS